jgi:hypothetical protein
MNAPDSPRPSKPPKFRRDGWTPERQLRFLGAVSEGESVANAAAFAGMSRESAYRLRNRPDGALFGALWDRVFADRAANAAEVHSRPLTGGRLARLIGNHFRRNGAGFFPTANGSGNVAGPHRT